MLLSQPWIVTVSLQIVSCRQDQERVLLTIGIRDTQFILRMHRKPMPKVLSLLSLRMATTLRIPRKEASAALRELRLVEELAEGFSAPAARAA